MYQSVAHPTSEDAMSEDNGTGVANVQCSSVAATKAMAAKATVAESGTTNAAADTAAMERLQRHRSYHFSSTSQSRNHRHNKGRFDSTGAGGAAANHHDHLHRRATSVRVRPTFAEEEDDVNLPQPPVSIQVASPDDEQGDNLELNHRLGAPSGPPGAGGRRRSLPRVPVYDTSHSEQYAHQTEQPQWSPYSPGSAGPPDHGQHGGRRVSHQVEANFNQQQQQFSQPMDQFDQYFFQSTHIGQPLQDDSSSGLPPEVNIEVPSDSDSSRRPSKYTLSNASSCHDISIDDRGAPGQTNAQLSGRLLNKGAITTNNFHQNVDRRSSGGVVGVGTGRSSPRHAANELLGARPNMALDRRKSHTGVSMGIRGQQHRGSVSHQITQGNGGTHTPQRRGAAPAGNLGGQMLLVPNARARGSSLPGNMEVVNQDDIYRLRNFSKTGKKIVNRGDSVKARSRSSLASTCSSADILSSRTNSGEDFSFAGSESSSRRPSKGSRRSSYRGSTAGGNQVQVPAKQYRVTILGAAAVGKSSLTSQFLSSDHMNTYDTVEDDVQKIVSVCVDGKEAQMVFIDHAHSDMALENQIATYMPNGYMVVFAVDDSDSLVEAERTLIYLKSEDILGKQAVILVANKTDLVRSRVISTSAGNSLAVKYGCKYIETSPGINHNVDELLVGMLTQIQLRDKAREGESESGEGSGGKNNGSISGGSGKKKGGGQKVLDLLQSVWKSNDSKSKSSGNLHVL